MKTQSTLKIELTQDKHRHIEANSENQLKQEDAVVSRISGQSQLLITGNSNMVSDSYGNNSDILSISKTDSNISIYSVFHQKEKDKDSTSNLLISFSNISEADPRVYAKEADSLSINLNISSNSIICKKDQSQIQKSNSFTPSTLCNYYLRSNDVTPNKVIDPNIFNQSIKQTNLNLIYSSMNNTNIEDKENTSFQMKSTSSKKNIFMFPQDKKTPIKYTKSQLKNEGEGDIEEGKKNLMLLFNDGDDIDYNNNISSNPGDFFAHIQIKENNVNFNVDKAKFDYKIETINNFSIENKANNPPKETTFPLSPNNYSNFSFDITRNNNFFKANKQEENALVEGHKETNQVICLNKKEIIPRQNNESVGNLNWPGNSNYVSPKFINGTKLNDSTGKASTIQSSNSEKKNKKTIEDCSPQNSNKMNQVDQAKYVSSFTLPTNQKNISPQNNQKTIISYKNIGHIINITTQKHLKSHSISPKTNNSKQNVISNKGIKRNFSFLRHYNPNKSRPSSASKSKSKEKRNTSNNSSNKQNETPKSITKPRIINNSQRNLDSKNNKAQLLPKQQLAGNEQININIIQKIKEKTTSNLINFINTLKPNPVLKDALNKTRKSPSPQQGSNKPKTAQINLANLLKKNITENKNPTQIKHVQTTRPKCEDNSSFNTTKIINNSRLSTMGKDPVSNTVISSQKKQAKVIQNFSNYKKKTSYQKHFVSKKDEDFRNTNDNSKLKSIISNKLQKLGGDEDNNILIEDM